MTLETTLCRIVTALAAILIIGLLMLDLVSEDRSSFSTIFVQYGIFLIVNSKLLCDVIMNSCIVSIRQTFFVWNVVYMCCNILNIATNNLGVPIPSRSVVNFANRLFWSINRNPSFSSLLALNLLVSGIYIIVPVMDLIISNQLTSTGFGSTSKIPGGKPSVMTPEPQRRASI